MLVALLLLLLLLQGATRVDARFLEHLAGKLGEDAWADWADDPANAGDLLVGGCRQYCLH
jgi:hypothetical protein